MSTAERSDIQSIEALLRRTAKDFEYPETPDLAVRWESSRRPVRRAQPLAWAGALILILAIALFLSVPQVRAAVREFLDVGVVRILFAPTGALPTAERPVESEPVFDLAGETSFQEAQELFGAQIRLPQFPPELGSPDRVYYQDIGGPSVVMIWENPERPFEVLMSLQLLRAGAFLEKVAPEVIQQTSVNNHPAVWTTGPYLLQTRSGQLEQTRLVTGQALIWAEGDITYRLETRETLENAVRIAESLR